MSSKKVIELNGKRYDALTGRIMPAHETVTEGNKTFVKPVSAHGSGAALDGFVKHASAARHESAPDRVHHKTEHSRTLMRHAVKKPAAPKAAEAKRSGIRHHQPSGPEVDPHRLARAKKVSRNHLVSRFGGPKPLKAIPSILPVRPEPSPVEPPILGEHHRTKLDAKVGSLAFQKAIDKANVHNQAPVKAPSRRHRLARRLHVSPKVVGISAASLSALLLIGFVAYQNTPNLSMRVATARAGIQGSLPGYQPAGFGLNGPIQYQPGQITISYKSHSDDRKFQISQRTSQWNSDALLENFVATDRRAYQTFQDRGKTIYIYDNDSATWVDGGIWYQVEGNSSLNSDQLLRIAASM